MYLMIKHRSGSTLATLECKINFYLVTLKVFLNFALIRVKMEDEHSSALDTLESRLENIERRVYGKPHPSHQETERAASEVYKPALISSTLRKPLNIPLFRTLF